MDCQHVVRCAHDWIPDQVRDDRDIVRDDRAIVRDDRVILMTGNNGAIISR
jgi:hypothetical protein